MLATGASTLWESFSPTTSLCHGFSATPVYQLSKAVLGVEPLEPAYARFTVAPEPAGLEWAQGIVPTVAGPISIEWRVADGVVTANLHHPQACDPQVCAAPGWRLLSDEAGEGARTMVWVKRED